MNDEEERVMKLCFAPLNSLIEYPSGERYVVSGDPIWSHNAVKDGVVANKIEPATEAEYYNSIKRK